MAENKEKCFVIMPFGGWFDNYYINIYAPAIEEAGLIPTRADDIYRPSTIIQDIWEMTKNAKIVLADLTNKNPNVFYELGLAHSLAKPAILVTELMADVPFDLRSLRVIEFDKNSHDWGLILKNKIKSSIKETLESPLSSVLPTFLEIKSDSRSPNLITKHDKELLEIKQDIEFLKSQYKSPDLSSVSFSNISFNSKELEVLRELDAGLSIKEISQKLYISMRTINAIIESLLIKTRVQEIDSLLYFAKKNRIL